MVWVILSNNTALSADTFSDGRQKVFRLLDFYRAASCESVLLQARLNKKEMKVKQATRF